MISFYPGPSKIYPEVSLYMQQALQEGILSVNHRSTEFVDISKKTITLLKEKLNIPEEYSVFFTSSATECWEIIAQSLIEHKSFHVYNGAFGEKWYEYTQRLKPSSAGFLFDIEDLLDVSRLHVSPDTEMICIVQNETSNATQISNDTIQALRLQFPHQLIAVDATSSMAGIHLEFTNADIWFASVQKCFGLPAGMGILVCSPFAIQKAQKLHEQNHYNSLSFMIEKMKDWQTTYTPNVLSIYLLQRVMQQVDPIFSVNRMLKQRAENWDIFLNTCQGIEPLIKNPSCRSCTVIALKASEKAIQSLKEKAREAGIILGNGYGKWAKNTFRIANFPAISEKEIKILQQFMATHLR